MPTAAAPNPDTRVTKVENRIESVKAALDLRAEDIQAVLPPGMDARRFTRVSLLAISKNPDLLECTPTSIIRSIVEAAEIGLEPTGSLNRAWLVPFRENASAPKEAQLMIGYQGYADLMRDSGKIGQVWAEAVFQGDVFKVVKGSEPRIIHEPKYETEDPTKVTHVYAIAVFKDGTQHFEVMTRTQVELIRAKSRQKNGPTWTQNWIQMARKTAVRRLQNYVPLSARAIEAIARDDEREFGDLNAPIMASASSATSKVKDRLKNRRGAQPETVKSQPTSSKEPTEVEGTAVVVSDDSAGGQTDAADEKLCNAGSDPKLGDVETCVLEPGHVGADNKPSPHKAASGAVFPNAGPQS
jgi:recombination protein RecT